MQKPFFLDTENNTFLNITRLNYLIKKELSLGFFKVLSLNNDFYFCWSKI